MLATILRHSTTAESELGSVTCLTSRLIGSSYHTTATVPTLTKTRKLLRLINESESLVSRHALVAEICTCSRNLGRSNAPEERKKPLLNTQIGSTRKFVRTKQRRPVKKNVGTGTRLISSLSPPRTVRRFVAKHWLPTLITLQSLLHQKPCNAP